MRREVKETDFHGHIPKGEDRRSDLETTLLYSNEGILEIVVGS